MKKGDTQVEIKKEVYADNAKSVPTKIPFAVAESYKSIRTNLLFLLRKEKGNVLAVSSANVGEGKSTTAINLAIAFSQLGRRALLIDADLRRPSIYKKAKLSNEVGLPNVIAGFNSLEECINTVRSNLDVLTAGRTSPNPSELLGSAAFSELLEKVKNDYDFIIIDTPPINVVSDGLIVSALTDGLLLVAREKFTIKEDFEKAINAAEFANIKLLGAVMNGTNAKAGKGYRKYRKSGYEKYKYGYSKY